MPGEVSPLPAFVVRRLLHTIPLLFLISIISFTIIKLPPVNYLDIKVQELRQQGDPNAELTIQQYKERYGLHLPGWQQYLRWMGNLLRGDLGVSFEQNERPVAAILADRLPTTLVLTLASLLVTYAIAIPVGVYCAVRQYSWLDHLFSFIAFIGMSLPGYLVALVVMFVAVMYGNQSVGGLFSPEYVDAPWSWAKFLDLLRHLWVPVIIIALTGTAGLIRIVRSSMLEVLSQDYIRTARAKGLKEITVILGHGFRNALIPLVTIIGLTLPSLLTGEALIAIVMNLPTMGPVYLRALQVLDMYLAGSFLLILACTTVLGNLIADVLLAWVDPRIRFQ